MGRLTHQPRPYEEAYFHSGNSGLTLRLTERQYDYTDASHPEDDGIKGNVARSEFDYRFEVTHGAFGENSRMSFPLSEGMLDFLIEAATHLKQRMGQVTPRETAFDRNTNPLRSRHYMLGLKVESVYSPEVVESTSSSASYLTGHRLIDPMTDQEVAFIPFDGKAAGEGRFSGSGEPCYRETDIGKPVAEVEPLGGW